ncbi:hypothetical protein [Microbacterium luticocti]|uniref:hypothetical protein n=1 Tax=Microbacterium luticocti TaxID=451764 RepID=UPI00041AF854|nr:hypothetical protein [Microbacterium luticocti]
MTRADPTPDPAVAADAEGDDLDAIVTSTVATSTVAITALSWWDDATVTALRARTSTTTATTLETTTGLVPAVVPLLPDRPRRSALRARMLVPLGVLLVLVVGYAATMGLWPLGEVAPTVTAATVSAQPAAAASVTWPATGAAGVAVSGFGAPVASTTAQSPIASITKVVTALLVLDRSPVTASAQGIAFRFSYADNLEYWSYLRRNESALDVPVGGSLTEYQMLQGMLIASASNYAARLAGQWWPSDESFASAANAWLAARRITGITIADPTGFDARNTATPAALVRLAQVAMDNPVIAEIVAQKQVTLPGAGTVTNTNELLADPGVVGMKTGILDGYNVLAVKDVTVGGTTVQVQAAVLNQPDAKTRWTVARNLFAQVQAQLQPTTAVAAGTVVGTVSTAWGASVAVVASSDADLVLWNAATPTATAQLTLGDDWAAGAAAGSVTVTGPVQATTVDAALADELDGPGLWWRITHPLQLLGVA